MPFALNIIHFKQLSFTVTYLIRPASIDHHKQFYPVIPLRVDIINSYSKIVSPISIDGVWVANEYSKHTENTEALED